VLPLSKNVSIREWAVSHRVGHVWCRPFAIGRSAESALRTISPSASFRTIVRSISASTASGDGIRPAETEAKSWVQRGQGEVRRVARFSRSCSGKLEGLDTLLEDSFWVRKVRSFKQRTETGTKVLGVEEARERPYSHRPFEVQRFGKRIT
jgi:hypothetical protein